MKYRNHLLIIFLLCNYFSYSQNTTPPVQLSLNDCIDYALKHNASIKNAKLDIELQKAQNAEVTGRTLPQINAQGRYQNYLDPMKSILPSDFLPGGVKGGSMIIPFSVKQNSNLGVTASQLLFNGSIFVALQARNSLMNLANETAQLKEEDIRVNIEKAYWGLIIAHKQFEILKNSLELIRKGNEDIQATYKQGLIEKLEVDRNTVQLSNLESDSLNVANNIELAEQLLKFNMGMKLENEIILFDEGYSSIATDKSLLLKESTYENVLSYRLLNTVYKLKQYDLKRHRFDALPTLSLAANAAYNYAAQDFDVMIRSKYLTSSFIIAQIDIPLFDGWQRRSRVRTAKLNIEKAANDIENAKLGIDLQLQASKTNLSNALQSLASRERTMKLAQSVYDLSNKKYKAGVGSNQDVMIAQAEWLQSQNNYFTALQTVVNAKADLRKALGLLTLLN